MKGTIADFHPDCESLGHKKKDWIKVFVRLFKATKSCSLTGELNGSFFLELMIQSQKDVSDQWHGFLKNV